MIKIGVDAEYKEQIIEEYKNNPYIETLPKIFSRESVLDLIANYPSYNESERLLESEIRVQLVQRLFNVFQPLPFHMDLENRLSAILRTGYLPRNPLKQHLGLKQDFFPNTASGLKLIGYSGAGKTTAVQRILALYPQVVVHKEYKNIPFSCYQVTYLKLEFPYDSSIRGFCIDFFLKLDAIIGSNFYSKYVKSTTTVDSLLALMSQTATNVGLGLLVVDEVQHISTCKAGGEKILNFFVTFLNSVNVPVVLIGTMKALPILNQQFRQARRGFGEILVENLKIDASWDIVTEAIWPYQWTKNKVPLTKDLRNLFYHHSQGIIDIFVKLYALVQIQSIVTSREKISAQLIEQVSDKNLKFIQPMLHALRTNDIFKLAKYEDICSINIDFNAINIKKPDFELQKKAKELQETRKQREKSNKMTIREEAILKLIDLGNDIKKSSKIVRLILKETPDLTTNEIVVKAIKKIEEIPKKTRKKNVTYDESDIRFLVIEGKKQNKTVYEVLKENHLVVKDGDLL